jgi:hypothetical protein
MLLAPGKYLNRIQRIKGKHRKGKERGNSYLVSGYFCIGKEAKRVG